MARVLNLIKLANQTKRSVIKMHLGKNDMRIIRLLIKFNFIQYIDRVEKYDVNYIKKTHHTHYYVTINTKSMLRFKNLYRPSGVRTISYKELAKNSLKKKCSYVLSTTAGFITQQTALQKQVSGILFMILY